MIDPEFFSSCDFCGKKSYSNILDDNTAELLKLTQEDDLWICEECRRNSALTGDLSHTKLS